MNENTKKNFMERSSLTIELFPPEPAPTAYINSSRRLAPSRTLEGDPTSGAKIHVTVGGGPRAHGRSYGLENQSLRGSRNGDVWLGEAADREVGLPPGGRAVGDE